MTAPRTPSPLDGALLVEQGRGLLSLYQGLCRPSWLELLAPQAAAALDDPMQNLERLLAHFANPAWEAEAAGQTPDAEEPSTPGMPSLLQPRPGQPVPSPTLRAGSVPAGAAPALRSFPAASAPPETVLNAPVSRQPAALPPAWEAPQNGVAPLEPSVAAQVTRRSSGPAESETGLHQPDEVAAPSRLESLQPGARQQSGLAPRSPLSHSPGIPVSSTQAAPPALNGATAAPASPSTNVVRLVTAPGRLSSLLQANLSPTVSLNERSTNQSMGSTEDQNPFNSFSKSVVSSVTSRQPGSGPSADDPLPHEARDQAHLERLVDEHFARWLEELELAYLRTYGTSGG